MARPDYVIIGAMKCGTSTLAAQLGAQPGLYMSTPKEPNFFSDDDVFARGPDWYAGLFAAAAPGDLAGEASTHYTKLPDHPHSLPRLAAMLPAPRLIYLIRDPVARAVSHYIHDWTENRIATGIEAALAGVPGLIDYGRYGMQIAPWVDRFGAGAIHVDTLEAMTADPQALIGRVGRFLGRDDLRWIADLDRMNASAERLRRRPLDRLLIDSPPAAWLRRTLVPRALRDRIKAGRRLPARPEIPPAVRARIEAVFARDRAALHSLFPGRPDLDLAYPFVTGGPGRLGGTGRLGAMGGPSGSGVANAQGGRADA